MNTAESQFSTVELQKIDLANDLKISPFRTDGRTYGTPTWIWSVVVEGNLYVRPYNGKNSRWYQAAIQQKAGRIHAAEMILDVVFETLHDELLNEEIDKAYQRKYNGSPYLPPMLSQRVKQATIRIQQKV